MVGLGRCGEPWRWLQEVVVVGLVPGASGTSAVLGDIEVWEAARGDDLQVKGAIVAIPQGY